MLAPFLAGLLLLGVAAAIWFSFSEQRQLSQRLTLRGYTGSENIDFFRDQATIQRLAELGFAVEIRKAGSREIASLDLKDIDFVMPSGAPAAEKIRAQHGTPAPSQPFHSLMAIASWRPIAEILVKNGFAELRDGIYWLTHLDRLLQAMEDNQRWSDLSNSQAYPANKRLMISSTDLRHSNSAAMYAALASQIWHGDVLQSIDQARALAPRIARLFLGQGYTEHSSSGPFEDYLVMGMGKAPLVLIYESQFLAEAAAQPSRLRSDMVLLYPQPTLFSERQFIPLKPAANHLADVLMQDQKLQQIATQYGFRSRDPRLFQEYVAAKGLRTPEHFVDVVNPPTFEVMEALIDAVAKLYH
ncbi:MAG: hypothetical protein HQL47_03625 [Gammaproteobacteria bacterium]|nr:hypothetical protein [Gammaproteobacteria bacterium]